MNGRSAKIRSRMLQQMSLGGRAGRTEVPPVRAAEDPEGVAAMAASEVGMPPAIAAALREIGPKIDGPRTAVLDFIRGAGGAAKGGFR